MFLSHESESLEHDVASMNVCTQLEPLVFGHDDSTQRNSGGLMIIRLFLVATGVAASCFFAVLF